MSGVTVDGKEFTYTYMPNTPQLLSQMTSPVHTVQNTWEPTRDTLAVKTNKWKNKANTPVISAYAYTMNNLGQRTGVTTSGEVYATISADRVWQYDSLGQVISANDNHYTYDQIGNRTITQKGTEQPVTYTPNSLNQYAYIGNITPTYDADGNQLTGLQATTALPERNQLTFVYNAQNRPIQVKQNSTIRENYTYDHQGRRTQKGDTLTLYDGYNAIAEYNLNTRSLKTTYAWGNDLSCTLQGAGGVGGLLSATDYTTQIPSIAYPAYDGNGNITEYLTEENNGTLTAHYEYDAFGNVVKKAGEKEYSYQFSAKPYDTLTGLNYYNYRNYDPPLGRWLGRDPVAEKGGLNLYSFVKNSPVFYYDFMGMSGYSDNDIANCLKVEVKVEVTGYPSNEIVNWEPDVPLKKRISRLGMARAIGSWMNNKVITTQNDEKCPCSKIRESYEKEGSNSIKISVEIIKNDNKREVYIYPGGYTSKTFIGVFEIVEKTYTTGGTAHGDQVLPVSRASSLIGLAVKITVGQVVAHNESYYL